MGKSATLTDTDIEEVQRRCPALGVSPPHKRRIYTPRPEMTYKEISAVMGCSSQTVKNIVRSAYKKQAMM